jgi:tetratricopeptide (TPR) repeat protein
MGIPRHGNAIVHFELKPISRAAVGEALEKAKRYRLLNEPTLAESICLDVLEVDPENQRALVTLLLAITDQFGHGAAAVKARELLPRLKSEYEQQYYAGIVWERSAHAQLRKGPMNTSFSAYDSFLQAMGCYERAIELQPPGNDDAILRWNTCARILMRNPNLRPKQDEEYEPVVGE